MDRFVLRCVTAMTLVWAGGYAQIPMRSLGPVIQAPERTAFDSTRNFQGTDAEAYVGQALHVRGLSMRMRGFGYERFYSRVPEDAGDTRAIYKRGAPLNRFNSQYDALAFRSFVVVDVVRSGKGAPATFPQERVFLKMLDKGNSEIIYFEYSPRHESLFPFVSQGYFEKLRRTYQGLRYVVRRTEGVAGTETAATGVRPGDTVVCSGFFVEDRTYALLGSFKRVDGVELFVAPRHITDGVYLWDVGAAGRIREEVGAEAFGDVLRGRVKPGMSERMCELAWGKPSTVNRIVHQQGNMEQWVYPAERAVYLENGVVSSVQDGEKERGAAE